MAADSVDYNANAEKVYGLSQGDNTTTNIDNRTININHNYSSQHVSSIGTYALAEGKPLSEHDGCWRLLITIRKAKHVEGGNRKTEQAFILDPKLVNPEASHQWPLQQLWEYPLPSGEALSFDKLDRAVSHLITVARSRINTMHREGTAPEILVVVSLEYKLITDLRWVSLLKRVKRKSKARPPIAMACLTRQSDGADYEWLDIGNQSDEYSRQIVEIMRQAEKQFKDLNWLLVDDENSNHSHGVNLICTHAQVRSSIPSRKSIQDMDKIRTPLELDIFFANHHALWLRWPGNAYRFAKRFDKIIRSGIPLFLLELPSSEPARAVSVGHLLDWNCLDFIPRYCKCHRNPLPSSADQHLTDTCLYWEDHRYKPLKTIPVMPTESLVPFTP